MSLVPTLPASASAWASLPWCGGSSVAKAKRVWILSGVSESCDHYDCAGVWDHKPTDEEVAAVLVGLDCLPAESEEHAEQDGPGEAFCHQGQWYSNYVHY